MDTVSTETPQPRASPADALAAITAAQNFNIAIAAGIGAALIGAILWAIVTVATDSELGIMAIAVGFVVGRAIRATGHGIDQKFGYLGAVCALFGCLLGNLLSMIAFYAKARGIGFGEALGDMDAALLGKLVSAFSQPMDLVFYGIAIYEGYKFSFKYRVRRQASVPGAQA
jgi:hypothetical protein